MANVRVLWVKCIKWLDNYLPLLHPLMASLGLKQLYLVMTEI